MDTTATQPPAYQGIDHQPSKGVVLVTFARAGTSWTGVPGATLNEALQEARRLVRIQAETAADYDTDGDPGSAHPTHWELWQNGRKVWDEVTR